MKRKYKKKKIQRSFQLCILLFAFVFALGMIDQYMQNKENVISFNHPSTDVQQYTPTLHKELQRVNLEEYTPVLAAIMQQESKGKGGDPMQASESLGLPPNTIKDPEQSIKQGVHHFQRTFEYGQQKNVDFQTIIQAYNMGRGYIDFVAENGGKHSEEIAKKFSSKQVEKNPDLYNCRGDKNNFRYPYCYGDFTYSKKVMENIELITKDNPVNADI